MLNAAKARNLSFSFLIVLYSNDLAKSFLYSTGPKYYLPEDFLCMNLYVKLP